mgnify:CR=1 FL=1
MMIDTWIHPSAILLAGAVILPCLPKAWRKIFLVMVPLLAFADVVSMQGHNGVFGSLRFMDATMIFGRVDALSMVFAYIMSLMCIIGTVYGLHVENPLEQSAAWVYVAGSLGVIFCGDYLTLFLFWEIMAFSSVFLVWFRRRKESLATGYRYLLVHTAGGLMLLAGIVLRYKATGGDMSFGPIGVDSPQLYTWLILAGFLLNAAVPPLHAWLPDAYGEATVAGAVFMCAFTTKTAVYALARGFAGMEILVPLGVIMALYGVVTGGGPFIEIFNNPEPLHEVNEKGVKLWENLVLSGEKLAATCGMDLHGNSTLHGHYSTYIQGEPDGDVCQELSDAIHNERTWVCKGPLLEVHNDGEALTFTIHQTGKPGYEPLAENDYRVTLRTQDQVITCDVSDRIPLASFAEHAIIIPMLFEKETIIENLVCTSPVMHL